MVLVAEMAPGGDVRYEITGIVAGYFRNLTNFLFFEVVSPEKRRGVPLYMFYFDLRVPNYAPVVLLPSATIESKFKFEFALIRFEPAFSVFVETIYSETKGYGSVAKSYYTVELRHHIYDVDISNKDVKLGHHNAITRFPIPMFASVVF